MNSKLKKHYCSFKLYADKITNKGGVFAKILQLIVNSQKESTMYYQGSEIEIIPKMSVANQIATDILIKRFKI